MNYTFGSHYTYARFILVVQLYVYVIIHVSRYISYILDIDLLIDNYRNNCLLLIVRRPRRHKKTGAQTLVLFSRKRTIQLDGKLRANIRDIIARFYD